MKQIPALTKSWLRRLYWKIRMMTVWDRLQKTYYSYFDKNRKETVDGKEFNYLFISPPSPDVLVDSKIWQRIADHLPENYRIPDQTSLDALLPSTGDYYHALFSNPVPMFGLYVDSSVWKPIKAALPVGYTIPDPVSLSIFKEMKAESYDSMFNSKASAPGIIVDSEVWKRVVNNLPKGYTLPDSITINVLNQIERGVGV